MSVSKRTLPAKKNGQATTVWVASVGSGKNRDRRQFATKREADAREAQEKTRMAAGLTALQGAKITVDALAAEYLNHMRKRRDRGERVTRSYFDGIESIIKNYILATEAPIVLSKGSRRVIFHKGLGGKKLATVTRKTIGDFRDDLRDAGATVYLTRAILRVAHAMFE